MLCSLHKIMVLYEIKYEQSKEGIREKDSVKQRNKSGNVGKSRVGNRN